MLKRIMSVFLVLTMLLVMGITVSATTATTEFYNLAYFGGENPGTTTITSGSITKTESISSKAIALTSAGNGSVQSVLHTGSDSDYYIANSRTILKYFPEKNYDILSYINSNSKPVISVSYDIMIPNDANATSSRTFELGIGETGATNIVKLLYSNGEFSVDLDTLKGIDVGYVSKTAEYKAGNWTTAEIRAYYDSTTTKLTYGVYIGDEQIFYGVGNVNYTSTLHFYHAIWTQGTGITTNMDDIRFCLLGEADKPQVLTEEEEVETSFIISAWNGEQPTTSISSGNVSPSETEATFGSKGKTIALSGSGNVSSISVENNSYISNGNTILKYIPRANYNIMTRISSEAKPVVSLKYDISIPIDANATSNRTFQVDLSKTNTTDKGSLTIKYSNGAFSVDETSIAGMDTASIVSNTIAYQAGNWTTVELRVYYNTEKKLEYGVYIGEEQIFYGVGSYTYDELYLWNSIWTQASGITTYMDDVTFSLLPDTDKPVALEAPVVIPDSTDIVKYDFNSMTTESTLTLAVAGTGVSTRNMVNSSSTSKVTTYAGESKTIGDMALVVSTSKENIEGKTSGASVVVSTPRISLKDYVTNDGTETVLVGSYDINIPQDSADTMRMHMLSLQAYDNTPNTSQHDFVISSYIDNGYLYFDTELSTEDAIQVDFSERSEKVAFDINDWETVNYVIKTTFDTDRYIVKLYGIYKGKCCYENTIEVLGSYMYVNNNSFYVYGLEEKDITTKYDNFKLTHVPAYSDEIVYNWSSADYIYPLALNYTNNSVEAKAKVVGSYANLCLVTAVYNNDGKLVKLWTDTTLEDGYLSYTVTGASYVQSGYKVKVFLFDSIISAIPYVENTSLVIE